MSNRLLTSFHFEWDDIPEEGESKAISLMVTVASSDYSIFEERFYLLRGFDDPRIVPSATAVNGITTEMFHYYKMPISIIADDISNWLSAFASSGWKIAPLCWDVEMVRRALASINMGDELVREFMSIKNCGLELCNFTDLQSIAKMLTMRQYPFAMVDDFARTMCFSKFYSSCFGVEVNVNQLEPAVMINYSFPNNYWNVRHLGKYQIALMNNFVGVIDVQQTVHISNG